MGFVGNMSSYKNLVWFSHSYHHMGYAGWDFWPAFLVVRILFLSYVNRDRYVTLDFVRRCYSVVTNFDSQMSV